MIFFRITDTENVSEVVAALSVGVSDREMLSKIASALAELTEEGIEVALTTEGGMLLARIYDGGRYSFVYPIEIDEGCDTVAALNAIVDYSRRELIPVYFTDVPREEIDTLTSLFDHVDARAYDDDEDSFVAVVNSECDMIDLPPTVSVDGVTLSALVDRDSAAFAAICRDREVNKYWGFDDTADLPDAPDEYYLEIAESELMRGVALSLAVRYEGALVGEAVLFDFDYRGSAMAGVRLAKEYHGRGIGGRAFDALIEVARRIGLKSLRADVMEENIPSLRMIERRMERGTSEGGVVHFTLSL